MSHNKGVFRLGEFLEDSRGAFNIFTILSLAAAICLVFIGFKEVETTGVVQTEVIYSLFVMYSLSVLSDSLLAAVIERGVWKMPPAPDTQVNASVSAENMSVTPESVTVGAGEPNLASPDLSKME